MNRSLAHMKVMLATGVALSALVGANSAFASGGVVFIHGTNDYPGPMTCTSGHCVVSNALAGYWTPGEITSVSAGRPYAIVGFAGGTCAPWASGTTTGLTAGNVSDGVYYNSLTAPCTASSNNVTNLNLTGGSGTGQAQSNGDVIAAQIAYFLANNTGVTELTLVTHSGGSNQARYILENYSRNANYKKVHSLTKRVVMIAGATLGTYLANEVFAGAAIDDVGGLAYLNEGTNVLRTDHISTYNSPSSYFAGATKSPVQGVGVYSTGGVSAVVCNGVTIWGVCVGWKGPTLGNSSCDSYKQDLELLVLHDLYLSGSSNPGTNGCSDGFIPCPSSEAMGNTFSYNVKQDHNQSRRQCNNLDTAIRGYATGNGLPSGFDYADLAATQVPPTQIDSCGFSVAAPVVNSHGATVGYTAGCPATSLGNGICDWDCVALYGHDATPTWSGTPGSSAVTAWGSSDDCTSTTNNSSSTYGGVTYLASSASVWGEANQSQTTYPVSYINTYLNNSGSPYYTQFNGQTCDNNASCNASCGSASGAACAWYTDPNYATTTSAGYCPPSWFNDGNCDECMLALAGGDGTDCLPGRVTWCGGIQTEYPALESSLANHTAPHAGNPVYNELNPSSPTSGYQGWSPLGASGGDRICESSECGASVSFPGTTECNSTSDCAAGFSCQNGGCTSTASGAAADCTATYNLPPRTCATNADCTGNACQASTGTCLLTGGACATDANCPVPSGATSTCNGSGVCSCTTSADCSGGAACNSNACATSVTSSLCR
jgi:hypothetical protein